MIAVVCDDQPGLRNSVVRLLVACGFDVPGVTESFLDVRALVLEHSACVAIVALSLTGMSGLGAVSALCAAAPDCEIVLLSPSGALELAALEAGARALVPENDLRVLRSVLTEIAAAPPQLRLPRTRAYEVGAPGRGKVSTNPSS